MAVTLLRCDVSGAARWGVVEATGAKLLPDNFATTVDIFAHDPRHLSELATGQLQSLSELKLISPITRPGQIICQGLNYPDHASEAGHERRQDNCFFQKASSSLSGPFDSVLRPRGCELLDYEVELGLVLKKTIDDKSIISDITLGEVVGGFVVCNEISARDLMFGAPFIQWFYGKSYRTFCPCGPYLLVPEPDEVLPILASLELKLWLNGELRQSARAADMIFGAVESLTEIASFMDMNPGDLLLTGTPGGVLAQATPAVVALLKEHLFADEARRAGFVTEQMRTARFLTEGDVVRAAIASPDGRFDLGEQMFKIAETV